MVCCYIIIWIIGEICIILIIVVGDFIIFIFINISGPL